MDRDILKKAIGIDNEINDLNCFRDNIDDVRYSNKLTYVQIDRGIHSYVRETPRVTEILERHDRMIRKEIDEVISQLEKEIEEL